MAKHKQIGSLILKPKDILIQYSNLLFDMSRKNNDVYILLVMGYIKKHVNLIGEIFTTIDHIVEECGYYTKSNSKENNKYFKDAIKKLADDSYIVLDNDISTIKNYELLVMHLNQDNDLFTCNDKFVTITVDDFNKIISCSGNVKKGMLLNTYLAIKQFIFNSGDIAYPSKSSIAKIIGVSSLTTVEKLISMLVDIGLIYVTDDYYVKNKDGSNTYIQARRLYATDKSALSNSKQVLREFYNGMDIYNSSEIDMSKIIRLKGRK